MATFQKIVASVGILLAAVSAARHSSAQSSTLTAFYTAPVVSMAPMWIAKEAGFFKKQGLDVKLVFIAPAPSELRQFYRATSMSESSADLLPYGRSRAAPRIWSSSAKAKTV